MTEQILKDYFEGKATVVILAADLKDSQEKTGYDTTAVFVDQINEDGEFYVTKQHLLRLCNDTINGDLTTTDLNTIAFALMTSDYFIWDSETKNGDIISTTIFDWDNPEINFNLTIENLILWREYLKTGEYKLNSDSLKRRD